jgi:phospholipid/cholesterol/gamma-HCH transport system substrate-binding protein
MLHRHTAFGVGFLVLLALIAAGTVASYQGSFRDTIEIHAVADRAGLTLERGGQVKYRGLQIGTIADIRPHGDRVDLDLRIDREYVASTPSSVTAQVIPPTAFGAKFVQLTAGDGAIGQLRDGQEIRVDHVGTEVNTAFANLSTVLDAARPRDVAGAISAVASTVDGQGDRVGGLIDDLNGYLAGINSTLPALDEDLVLGRDVLRSYDEAAPDIAALARDGATVAGNLTRREKALDALARDLGRTSRVLDKIVVANSGPLADLLQLVLPVARILERYSPELPCVIEGAVRTNALAEKVVGGVRPGISTYTEIQPPAKPYDPARNQLRLGDSRGPGCYGLPQVEGAAQQPAPGFVSGVAPGDLDAKASPSATVSSLFSILTGTVTR